LSIEKTTVYYHHSMGDAEILKIDLMPIFGSGKQGICQLLFFTVRVSHDKTNYSSF